MADYLLEEIIINILQRLPVKTLLRCTAVSKSWYSLINSPHFISSHLRFSSSCKKSAPLLLLRRCITNSEHYELHSDTKSFPLYATFEFPFKSMNSFFTILGSCNGLLCLSDDRVYFINTIILWNPCIKKSVLLPKPNMIYNPYGSFTQCLGFGFDRVGNDYKVVRITYTDLAIHPQIEVYKVSSGVWRDMSHLGLEHIVYNRSRHVYLNGASHWIAREIDSHDLILLFDMSREVFRTIMLPICLVSDPSRSHELVVYNDSLALVLSGGESPCCVWVMGEYGVEKSWTKKFCLDSNVGSGFVRPLWMRKEGGVVGVRKEDGCLVCYDEKGEEVEDLGVRGSGSNSYRRSLHVDSYMISLVLLEKGRSVSDADTRKNLPVLQTGDRAEKCLIS